MVNGKKDEAIGVMVAYIAMGDLVPFQWNQLSERSLEEVV
jgi:hypothetical protein